MFRTAPNERLYLGLIHPVTNEHYYYDRLPMGTRNSPAASGRFGLSFIRELLQHDVLFGGLALENTVATQMNGSPHIAGLGEGRALMGEDGYAAVLVWLHVDDILLHDPTYNKVAMALTFVMDTALRLGLICQRKKTVPPCQEIKFCGFIYNTTSIPTLSIPEDKISKALVYIDFLWRGGGNCCRLRVLHAWP